MGYHKKSLIDRQEGTGGVRAEKKPVVNITKNEKKKKKRKDDTLVWGKSQSEKWWEHR